MATATPKIQALALSSTQLGWLRNALETIQDSTIMITEAKAEIETNLGDQTPIVIKWLRSDYEAEEVPHVLFKVVL